MTYSATNPAFNCTLAEAQDLIAKLTRLGFNCSELYVNGQVSSGVEAPVTPISELMLDQETEYNFVIQCGGDWRNVALLKRMYGNGSITEFQRVADELGVNRDAAVQRIPGYVKVIENLIKKV